MSLEVVMPQMGESITEGTVSKWLKQVGEKVEKDESLLEISTDKVDAEVPSPGAGVLLEIRTKEGETVEVGTVVAVIGDESSASLPSSSSSASSETETGESIAEETKTEPIVEQAQSATTSSSNSVNSANSVNSVNSTEVIMPQMGESITEGTVSKWLKSVGEKIEKDEPLLEISTDKVDAEIPSPAAGTLLEIKVQEGETVEVGSIVAFVGAEGAISAGASQQAESSQPIVETPKIIEAPKVEAKAAAATAGNGRSTKDSGQISLDELRRTKSSPLVRNIAKEHGVDISQIPGSGVSGRVTKKDIMSFIETGGAFKPQDLLTKGAAIPSQTMQRSEYSAPQVLAAAGDRTEPMSVMRKKIAEHMTFSKQTSAHVTSVYEFDMTNVAKLREKNKAEFLARYGTKLTYMPFIFQAVVQALRQFPVVNAQVAGENIVYKGDINLGMAVALDWGLIVPVIKGADQLSLSGLALAANDLADRARQKKLMPDEVAGGTFTITNPGVFGGLFGTPIINQPQVAILCVGAIEKRPKVLTTPEGDDFVAIRTMAYFALTYDHRIVDGADAEKFLSFMKNYLETNLFTL